MKFTTVGLVAATVASVSAIEATTETAQSSQVDAQYPFYGGWGRPWGGYYGGYGRPWGGYGGFYGRPWGGYGYGGWGYGRPWFKKQQKRDLAATETTATTNAAESSAQYPFYGGWGRPWGGYYGGYGRPWGGYGGFYGRPWGGYGYGGWGYGRPWFKKQVKRDVATTETSATTNAAEQFPFYGGYGGFYRPYGGFGYGGFYGRPWGGYGYGGYGYGRPWGGYGGFWKKQ